MLPGLLVCWLLLGISLPAIAQMVPSGNAEPAPVEIPEELTREQVRDLIARLSDDQVRELIITQLDKLAQEQSSVADSTTYSGLVSEGMRVVWDNLTRILTSGNKLFSLPGPIWQQVTENGEVSGWFLLFQLTGLLLVGWATRGLVRRQIGKATSSSIDTFSPGKRFSLACYVAVMGMVELGAFAIGALLFVEASGQQAQAAQLLWYEVVWCLVLIGFILLVVRQVVSPKKAHTQLVLVSDAVAKQILTWTAILAVALILPLSITKLARDFGVDAETNRLLGFVFGGVFIGLLIVLAIRLRRYGSELISGGGSDDGSIRRGLARIWWVLAIVYILLVWLMSVGKVAATGESSLVPGLVSLLLFVLIPYLDRGLQWLLTRYFEYNKEEISLEAGAQDGETVAYEPGYIVTALRYARILMVLAILAVFVRLWQLDVKSVSAALVGDRFAGALFDISITILLAWALWGVIRISIERKLDDGKGSLEEGESESESDAGGLGGTRVETVLPLIRIFMKSTIIVMAVLISLSALGVNIGPLIAGAGVIGIAIGFGAQTLVRDIFSGFFYLIDDAFRIGEYVVIDQVRGTVEKISIRSFQLRHHNGPVHTIPYGEIRSLTNWSRDWAIMKFELRIPFETDIDMVRKIIKRIGLDMMENPAFRPLILQPLKSQGVNRMDDSALIIRCKFTAIPGQQYLIRREAFTQIQRVFEEKGIQFAPRRVLVEASTPQEAMKGATAVLDQEHEGGSGEKNS